MAGDESPNAALKIADAWWELAQKEADIARDSLRLHAGELYKAAMPNLTSALRKTGIERRLADIADLKPILAAAAANNPTGANKFPLGRWVNVLSFVDTAKNVVQGNWSRTGNEVDVAQSRESRIAIPVAVDGSYDLEVGFNRLQGIGEVRVRIPVGPAACDVEWGQESGISGLDMLDGRHAVDNRNPPKFLPPIFRMATLTAFSSWFGCVDQIGQRLTYCSTASRSCRIGRGIRRPWLWVVRG